MKVLKKVVIAAGGTAGHINPALAFAHEISRKNPACEIVFVGREDGMEYRLVKQNGLRFFPIDIHGFKRDITLKSIQYNLRTVFCLVKSLIQCRTFLKREKPDLVMGFGGYVSGPVVREAAKLHILTAIHEQNSFPGVTTKLLSKTVDHIFTANQDAANQLALPEKTTVVGNPVSAKILEASRGEARTRFGLNENQTCILSFGGSLGSSTINKLMAEVFIASKGDPSLFFIHATGEIDTQGFFDVLSQADLSPADFSCRVSQYIDDMADCLLASDLVVSRSGAITVSELATAGRASYLIPSPYVAENHQYYNALTLGNIGAAKVKEEKDLDYKKTAEEVLELARNRALLYQMGEKAKTIAVSNSAERIFDKIMQLE